MKVLVTGASGRIVRAILQMARALGMEVIAEGVETEAQRAYLSGKGCDEYQGFLCSPALPPDEFARLYQRWPTKK